MDNVKPGFYSQDDLRFLATICDLGAVALENGELFQKTQDLAIHDSLTSLFTKGYFLERLKEEYLRTIRKNRTFSLLMLDIDYFKHYNDKFGHSAGDLVLKDLSHNLVDSLKELNPIITRFGGEEFCILLSGIEKEKACTIAQELCARIANNQIILRNEPTRITVSIGVASLPCDTNEPIELIFTADRAMYKAKQKGRNQVACA
jgi:diguanylate cyclase (GGDEF)-like protein